MTLFEGLTIGLAALSLVATLALAIVGRRLTHIDRRGETRRQENAFILRGILTTGDLARATGLAFKEGRCNGCMDDALTAHEVYRQELTDFLCTPEK